MSSRVSTLPQPKSRTSPAYGTTRPPFQNRRQSSSQYPVPVEQQSKSTSGLDDISTFATEMHRQDSGYASTTSHDRQPRSPGATHRHASSTTSSRPGSRQHPPIRRSTASGSSIARLPKLSKLRSRAPLVHNTNINSVVTPSVYNHTYHEIDPYDNNHTKTSHTSYFHFPSLELHPAADDIPPRPSSHDSASYVNGYDFPADNSTAYQVIPPQTTHYWTSDQTRRLEYAAIDAASRGFKGWVMRHMVPDCFVPKAKRLVTFDDDTGSVRRYRIELETEDSAEKKRMSAIAERGFKKGGSSTW
ncbi:hypothetical protein SEPCBS57363_004615 [Sporothrix epigloea]|uniref:Uncharacterized protein n=1 Tax=Sporothrix epigloea TaxID=1892477 RepID=A0ABP0DT04_9PEZI